MKKIIFVLFSMVISMPLAAETPNLVSCKGKDGRDTLKLVYATTSRNGEPTFSYARLADGPGSRMVEASGYSIQSSDTVLGEIISVKDGKSSAPDRSTEWVSLVLPYINVIPKDPRKPDAKDPEVKFETVVVETTSKTSFIGVPRVPGVIQDSRYFDVKCTAKIALFEKPAEPFGH